MQRLTHALVFVLLFGLAHAAEAKVIFRGDFESGDRSQWSGAEMVASDRLQIVSDPVDQGQHALRVRVHQGDDPIHASGNRNELFFTGEEPRSGERYYRWQTLWPSDFRSANTWQLFTQFHHTGCCGSPPVEFYTRGEQLILRVSGVELVHEPLVRGRWRDFVFHVVWSADESVGLVELTIDGQQVLAPTHAATLYSGQAVYLKQGLYRDASISWDQVIFHDGMTVGTTLADVQPPAPQADPVAATYQPPAADSAASNTTSTTSESTQQPAFVQEADGTVHATGSGCASSNGSIWALLPTMLIAMQRRRKSW